MREGDRDRCLNCNEVIAVELAWSGLKWIHQRTQSVNCPPRTTAAPRSSDVLPGGDRG